MSPAMKTLWRCRHIATVLVSRFRQDRLGVTAGSLTFTTLLALVPLLTVMLAVFTAFPMFASLQGALERLLVQNLVPDTIARPVLSSLTLFAGKASRIGTVGLVVLLVTALALMLTIDRTLNALWRVHRPRSLGQRVLLYWTALTLGPLLLGASLTMASYALSASRGLVSAIPGGYAMLIDAVQFVLLAAVAAGLYHYVPHTPVRWSHAWAGGLFVSLAIEGAKKALSWYVASVPTLTSIYGAFAIVPMMLLWVYLMWVVVLVGAVITSSLPALLVGAVGPMAGPGRRFEVAVEVLQALARARADGRQALSVPSLARTLGVDTLEAQTTVQELQRLGWASPLDEPQEARWVLLVDPASTAAQPLLQACLLGPGVATQAFRDRVGWDRLTLTDLMPR